MKTLFICAFVTATLGLVLIAQQEKQYKNFAYGVAGAVGMLGLILYIVIFGFASAPPPLPTDLENLKKTHLETMKTAEDVLVKKHENDPDNVLTTLDLATALLQQSKFDPALDVLNKALAKNPKNPDLLTQRAIVYFSKGLYEAEKQQYPAALKSLEAARADIPNGAPFAGDLDFFIEVMKTRIDPKRKASVKLPLELPKPETEKK